MADEFETTAAKINADPEDADAWQAFVRQSWAFVFSCVRRLCGNGPECEDIVQSVYLRIAVLFKRNGSLPIQRKALFGYLRRTARNTTIDMLRKKHNENVEIIDLAQELVDSSQQMNNIVDLLDIFAPVDQRLIVLIAIKGMTQTEAAKELSTSTRTVERRMAAIRNTASKVFSN